MNEQQLFKKFIREQLTKIRNDWYTEQQKINDDYILLNKFFNDIYQEPNDKIFLCFTKNKHTYYPFSASIVNPTYSKESTVPFWYYCQRFSELDEMNVFICPNSFNLPKKKKNCVHQTNCLFVDIDDNEINFNDMTKDEVKNYLNDNYPLTKKVMPAWVTVSGHGLHLYFITETIEFYDTILKCVNYDEIDKRTRFEKSLITYFEADVKCLDLPREMRLPFSFNCKNNDRIPTKLYCYEENQYLFYDEMQIYLQDDEVVKEYFTTQNHLKFSKNKGSSTRTHKKENKLQGVVEIDSYLFKNYYFTHKLRKTNNSTMNTILDLEDYYKARWGFEGFRNDFYFCYVLRLKQFGFDKYDALLRCYDLNNDNDFAEEIEYIVNYHYEHNYKITNLKIHEHLKFSQLEINCFRCAYTEERKQIDKKKRLKRLSDKRKQERNVKSIKETQIDIIKNNPDMTRQELADILGISIRTVSNIKKQLKAS